MCSPSCGQFYLFVSVSVFTSRSLAMMTAAIMPTYQISSMLAQIIFSLFIMGAGFFINLNSMMHGRCACVGVCLCVLWRTGVMRVRRQGDYHKHPPDISYKWALNKQ